MTDALPIATTTATFEDEVLGSDQPVLLDFWAPWCPYCRAVAPILDAIAQEHNLKLVTVNQDEHPDLAERYDVQGLPTMFLIERGQATVRATGAAPKDDLERALGLRT
jgi:thioredoxin 1